MWRRHLYCKPDGILMSRAVLFIARDWSMSWVALTFSKENMMYTCTSLSLLGGHGGNWTILKDDRKRLLFFLLHLCFLCCPLPKHAGRVRSTFLPSSAHPLKMKDTRFHLKFRNPPAEVAGFGHVCYFKLQQSVGFQAQSTVLCSSGSTRERSINGWNLSLCLRQSEDLLHGLVCVKRFSRNEVVVI